MEPLISIITPSYNSAGFITPTINSVIDQSYENWELIIIDDKSKDDTGKLVEEFAQQNSKITLIRLDQNGGVANARNVGLAAAKGKYIAFLDSDDVWLKDKLAHQVAFMEEKSLPMSFCSYNKINEEGEIISRNIGVPTQIGYDRLLWHNLIIFSTSMVLKTAMGDLRFKKVGHEDWLFWLDLLKKCGYGYGLDEQLVLYRIRKGSISANKFRGMKYTWKLLRESEKIGLIRSAYLFSRYATVAFWKYMK